MTTRSVTEFDVSGKRVLVRVDFNVPLDGNGRVADDTRIRAALPTIQLLVAKGARVVLMSHLGRPNGKRDSALSTEPAGAVLAELLDRDVIHTDDCIGWGARKLAQDLSDGDVLLLENLRFHAGEKDGDEAFARQLAELGDFYVSDAFGTLHRGDASVAVVPTLFQGRRAAGLLVARELEMLGALRDSPGKPFVAILGGAKVSDKIGVLESLVRQVDVLLIGGAMAYTFLAARELPTGASLVESDKIWLARKIIERANDLGVALRLPTDHVVSSSIEDEAGAHIVDAPGAGEMGLDIGPATIERFAMELTTASTVFWNGPMGVFEREPFSKGTEGVARAVARSRAYTVVGGGDSAAAVAQFGLADQVSHVFEPGGGASLQFVQGKPLPGLVALEEPS